MSRILTATDDELRAGFFALRNREDVARLLDLTDERLIYHIYVVPDSRRYEVFSIPKKSGGKREISAPITALKIIQSKLNQVLQAVYETKPAVHGFARHKGIVSNARIHSKQRYVLNLDIEDFFPSIHFGRVAGLFQATPYNLPPSVAKVLAQICCFAGTLPQGAPTSPIVSNMLCSRLDSQLLRLAQRHRCIYTRYADDLTFSTSMPQFPSALAFLVPDGAGTMIGRELREVIETNGFRINAQKTRLQPRHRRQEVTGLTANKRPNIQRRYTKQVRAMLHNLEILGAATAEPDSEPPNPESTARAEDFKSLARVVKGKIDFLGMVRGNSDPLYLKFLEEFRALVPGMAPDLDDPLGLMWKQYQEMERTDDPRRRGYVLQDLIKRLFDFCGIPLDKPFTRNEGAEQIDGAFRLEGWHYIVECRWREQLANIRELDGLSGQVDRSGKQTMGFFLSINGWSVNVTSLLKTNSTKSIVLMNGTDLRSVLSGQVNLRRLIDAKLVRLNLFSEPFYAANDFLYDMSGNST